MGYSHLDPISRGHKTLSSLLEGFVDAMAHCRNALCLNNETIKFQRTLIPSDTQSNAKVDMCVLWWFCVVANRQKSVQFFFQEPPYFPSRRVVAE